MKNILDYLPDSIAEDKQSEHKYMVTINDIPQDQNPFHIRFDRKLRNYQLTIQPMSRWLTDGVPDGDWHDSDSSIEFKMVAYTEPTYEQFSQHIYDELHCAFKAMEVEIRWESDGGTEFNVDHSDITAHHVYRFLKALHKDYTNTEDFLRDYAIYEDRLYHDMKFASALYQGQDYMFARTFSGEIGRAFYDFMDIELDN